MANLLSKNVTLVYTPGTPPAPGSPGSPGSPAVPGHWMTVTEIQTTYSPVMATGKVSSVVANGNGTYGVQFTDGGITQLNYPPALGATVAYQIGSTVTIASVQSQVWVSPVPAIPAIPPVPGTSAQAAFFTYKYNPGWNSGAVSTATGQGDTDYSFSIAQLDTGAVTGLANPASVIDYGYNDIAYGIYVNQTVFHAIEKGVFKSPSATLSMGIPFDILRTGTQVYYKYNGSVFYTSAAPSMEPSLQAVASLYLGGDAISNAAIVFSPVVCTGHADSVARPADTVCGTNTDYATAGVFHRPAEAASSGSIPNRVDSPARPAESRGWTFSGAGATPAHKPGKSHSESGLIVPDGLVYVDSYHLPAQTVGIGLPGNLGQVASSHKSPEAKGGDFAYAEIKESAKPAESRSYAVLYAVNVYPLNVISTSPAWSADIEMQPPRRPIVITGAVWGVMTTRPMRAVSDSPAWGISATFPRGAVIANITSTSPKWRFSNWRARSTSPAWGIIASFPSVTAASSKLAWWGNLTMEGGPEVTKFTGTMGAFKQLARIGNAIYAIADDGDLYEVGGADDAGTAIVPVAQTVDSQWGSPHRKRCWYAWMGSATNLKITTVADGSDVETVDTVFGRDNAIKGVLPKGTAAVRWAFRFEAIPGNRLQLNWFQPDINTLPAGRNTR